MASKGLVKEFELEGSKGLKVQSLNRTAWVLAASAAHASLPLAGIEMLVGILVVGGAAAQTHSCFLVTKTEQQGISTLESRDTNY
jgi:hypothetical protein